MDHTEIFKDFFEKNTVKYHWLYDLSDVAIYMSLETMAKFMELKPVKRLRFNCTCRAFNPEKQFEVLAGDIFSWYGVNPEDVFDS